MAMKGYFTFSKLQHYWDFRFFSIISKTLVVGVLPLCRDSVGVFYSISRLGFEVNLFRLKDKKNRRDHVWLVWECCSFEHYREWPLRITQSSSITGASPSDCLVSYPGHALGWSYPSAEMQSVYSTAPADGADLTMQWSGWFGFYIRFPVLLVPIPSL